VGSRGKASHRVGTAAAPRLRPAPQAHHPAGSDCDVPDQRGRIQPLSVPEPEPGSWLPASALEALHGFLMFSGIVHCLDPPHPTQKEEEKACKTEPQFVLFFVPPPDPCTLVLMPS
jgi:hypothetical protein